MGEDQKANGSVVSQAAGSTGENAVQTLLAEGQTSTDTNNTIANAELERLMGLFANAQDDSAMEFLSPALTLEDLVASGAAAPLNGFAPSAEVCCPKCASSNPRSNRYCGMCAAPLAGPSGRPEALNSTVGAAVIRSASDPPKGVIVGGERLRRSLRMVELVLLSVLTAVLTYQLQDWWQPSMLKASHWLR